MCARIARHRGAGAVYGVDPVPERRQMAARHGIETLDPGSVDVVEALLDLTEGRGPHSVIDAVGMEAHGAPVAALAQRAVGMLPDSVAQPLTERFGVDRLTALHTAIRAVRRGGTVSIVGVYGGNADPLPMMEIFDKGLQLRMGQAHVKRWVGAILPLLTDQDPLGVGDLATHVLPLEQAPGAYEMFQKKQDGAVKVVLRP
jgi:threonine dehydrogenase-like Zn-dependent dehydrogenase